MVLFMFMLPLDFLVVYLVEWIDETRVVITTQTFIIHSSFGLQLNLWLL